MFVISDLWGDEFDFVIYSAQVLPWAHKTKASVNKSLHGSSPDSPFQVKNQGSEFITPAPSTDIAIDNEGMGQSSPGFSAQVVGSWTPLYILTVIWSLSRNSHTFSIRRDGDVTLTVTCTHWACCGGNFCFVLAGRRELHSWSWNVVFAQQSDLFCFAGWLAGRMPGRNWAKACVRRPSEGNSANRVSARSANSEIEWYQSNTFFVIYSLKFPVEYSRVFVETCVRTQQNCFWKNYFSWARVL